jgi:hypothetical protein
MMFRHKPNKEEKTKNKNPAAGVINLYCVVQRNVSPHLGTYGRLTGCCVGI